MIWLFLSILCSTIIALVFRTFKKYGVNTFQAIVVNYWVCTLCGSLLSDGAPFALGFWDMPWFIPALIMGCLFIITFNLMGYTTQNLGVTVVAISSKMSMVVPVVVAVFLYGDSFTILKIIGILMAIFAVYLSSQKNKQVHGDIPPGALLLPVAIFLITGFMDSFLKYIELNYVERAAFNNFLTFLFGTAASIGTLFLLVQLLLGKTKVEMKNIIAGVVLGIPNYGSILFLMYVLNMPNWESSTVFPINSIGIVVLSAFAAYLIFQERLSKMNVIGFSLAIGAIILIAMTQA